MVKGPNNIILRIPCGIDNSDFQKLQKKSLHHTTSHLYRSLKPTKEMIQVLQTLKTGKVLRTINNVLQHKSELSRKLFSSHEHEIVHLYVLHRQNLANFFMFIVNNFFFCQKRKYMPSYISVSFVGTNNELRKIEQISSVYVDTMLSAAPTNNTVTRLRSPVEWDQ